MAEYLYPSLGSCAASHAGGVTSAAPPEDVPRSPPNPPAVTDAAAKNKQQHRHRLAWLRAVLKAPLRALGSLRDSYVRGMTRCAGSSLAMAGGYSMAGAYPPVPRSYSCRSQSSEDDQSELVRAASQSIIATRMLPAAVGPDGVQRSRSAVVWRIDEDKEADFADGGAFTLGKLGAYPRSRSYAVGRVPPASSIAGGPNTNHQRRVGVAVA